MQMTSPSHLHTQAQVQQRNTYNHTYIKFFSWTKQNNLTLNPDKTTCTLFTPDPTEYKSNLDLDINNTALCMATVFNDKHAYIKRNFCKRNISKFCKFSKNELWNNIYYSGTQEAFTEFQRLINNHFNKSFNKQTFILNYKNRYPWMTNSLRTKIAEKKLGLKSIKNPNI